MDDTTQPVWTQFPGAMSNGNGLSQFQLPDESQGQIPNNKTKKMSQQDMNNLSQTANNMGMTNTSKILGYGGNVAGDTAGAGAAASSASSGGLASDMGGLFQSILSFL